MIADHIALSIPAIQIGRLIEQNIELASNFIQSTKSMIKAAAEPVAKLKDKTPFMIPHQFNSEPQLPSSSNTDDNSTKLAADSGSHQKDSLMIKNQPSGRIEPSIEEKANYTVHQNDTLTMIGKRTGHPWTEIYALNKIH